MQEAKRIRAQDSLIVQEEQSKQKTNRKTKQKRNGSRDKKAVSKK
jgi:hypothetical protein